MGRARSLQVTSVGALVNAGLAAIKLLTGVAGQSYALIADGIESMADIFGSFVVWSGLRIASQPADRDYPYGRGKAEPLSAIIVAMMLFAAALGIALEAVREIITPHHTPRAYTLIVLIAVAVVKETWFRIVRRVAHTEESPAVLVDAWHHRSDALTSVAAAIGISIALLGGSRYAAADAWAAIAASAVILVNATRLTIPPLRELMDIEPVGVVDRVRAIAASVPGVAGVEKVFARKAGPQLWVDMHVEVDPSMSVERAHGISHDVKDAIRTDMPQVEDVLVHIEPHHEAADARVDESSGGTL
jgi:cation diffusion facilitator family transporter